VLVLVAVFLSAGQVRLATVVTVAKAALMAVMVASIALLAIEPTMVRQVEMAEVRLPFVNYRFFGLGSNPNSFATLAIVNLLLTAHQPFRSKLLEAGNVVATLACLLLAQSQTSWLAILVALPVLLVARARIRMLDPGTLFVLGGLLSVAGLAALAGLTFSTHGVAITDFATGDRYRELTTLTGRPAIWAVAFAEWRDNLAFGYGPSMWDSVHRARLGMPFAFNAHNQLVHALSVAGLVGLSTFVPYFLLLGLLGVAAPHPERGLALALYLLVLVRSATEVPLDLGTPFANEFLLHFLLFTVLACSHRERIAVAEAKALPPDPGRPGVPA
jgi:O-antigen ligase